MRFEISLLNLCAAVSIPADRPARIRSLARGGLEWDLFETLAVHHRVFPLVFKALSPAAAEVVPRDVWERLRTRYFANLAKNMAARKELAEALSALDEQGVTAVPYKGPVLAEAAYGDIGLRHFNDLDLLVKEEDVERAISVFRGRGFGLERSDRPAAVKRDHRYLRDYGLRRPGEPCPLEIQWRLVQKYHPLLSDREGIWSRLREFSIEGRTARTLSLEDTLLVLCLHGLYHSWENLQMVADVGRAAAAGPSIDWPGLLERTRGQGGLRILLLGLLLARDLLSAPVPHAVSEAAAEDRFITGLASRMSAHFFEGASPARRARSFFFREARMIVGPANRIRYLLGRILTPNEEDREAFALPTGLFFLYPLWRASRLFRKYLFTRNE